MLLRIALTVVLELLAAVMFMKINRKNLIAVFLVNTGTQMFLYVFTFTGISFFSSGLNLYYPLLLFLELIIVLIEGKIYHKTIPENELPNPYTYSTVANLISFIAGLLLIPV